MEDKMVKKGKAYIDLYEEILTFRDMPFFYVSFSWLPEVRFQDYCRTDLGVIKKRPKWGYGMC